MGNAKDYWQKVLHSIDQFAMPRTRKLERELSAVVEKNQSLTVELESVRNEFESERNRDRSQVAAFGQRITDLETERDTAHQQLHALKTLLTEASIHQEATATQVRMLESKLEEEYTKHASLLETMHVTLVQVQNKQQTLLTFTSGLDDSVRKTKQDLLEVIHTESVKPHTHVFAMILVAALFLLNTITGATSIWIFRQDLLELSAVTNDLKLSIMEHISQHEVALMENSTRKDASELDDAISGEAYMPQVSISKTEVDSVLPGLSVSEHPGYESAKWGQPLLLEGAEDQGYDSTSEFDPLVKEVQTNLLVLGFNLGPKGADGIRGENTERALREFQFLYQAVFRQQQGIESSDLATHVRYFANLAREDERKYEIDSEVLAAIRLSNLRTGVDFSFMMELAAAESAFNTDSRAAKSSATGLYQFKDETWLETVKRHGEKYGIGGYASQVDFFVDGDGNSRPMISDPVVNKHVLDLRNNPRMAALMAAEYLKDNMRLLSLSLDQELGRTEMYLTHFLGASGAITFLKLLGKNPDKVAGEIFPGQASRNTNIFHTKNRKPRTVAEVYNVLDRKFSTSRYEDWRKN